MTTLDTNFNTAPYFDDLDEAKRFYRILFRPSIAVQARELTQVQSLTQQQISRFGSHVFKDGSVVDGIGIIYFPNVHYISLSDTFNTNTTLSPSDLDDTYLVTNSTESTNCVRAVIKLAKDGVEADAPATNRFYLDYIATGTAANSADVNLFEPGDTLYIYDSNQSKLGTLDANNLYDSIDTLASNGSFTSNGFAYCIKTTDGIIFQKGFFVVVNAHTITVRDYSTNVAGYVVGFDTIEEIITENNDDTLFDNALGYPNENAPGAHRLRLTPTLVAKTRTDSANNTDFFAIVEFDGQNPTEQNDDPAYNILQQQLARRTYEESGDYVIEPFQIETTKNDSNTSNFYYNISPGVAYVRGNRIEKIGPTKLEVVRATTSEYALNQIVTANYGNYVKVDELAGIFDVENVGEVSLFDTAQNTLSDYEGITAANTGSDIGKANIRAVVYESGTKGQPNSQYLLYLSNIRMNSGKSFLTDVKSIIANSSLGIARADIVLESNTAVLKEGNKSSLVFYNGLAGTKRLTGNTGVGDTSYVYQQVKTATMAATGNTLVTIDTPASGGLERLNASSGSTLTGALLENYTVYVGTNAYSANISGSLAIESGNVEVVGSGTSFTTQLSTNNAYSTLLRIYDGSSYHIRRVVSVTNNTFLTLDASIGVTNAAANAQKYWVTGSALPLESVHIDSNTQFTANLGISLDSGSQTVTVKYPILRYEATAVPKLINKNVFVKIDCSNNAATTVGPWCLGLPDVHKIRNVYVGNQSYSVTNTNRTTWFELDNGQRDDEYGLARLVIKSQFASNIDANSRFLVELDHFTTNTSASRGFFSVESYPVDDTDSANTTGILTIEIPFYNGKDLRNYIDFRPRRANTANGTANATTATVNPVTANANVYSVPSGGEYIIAPDNNFTADFEYYLPRIDLITLNSSGRFVVNKGAPSTNPRAPFVESDQSAIAEVYVPPYPSATKREFDTYKNKQLPSMRVNLKTNKRYTMRDIGVIDERLKRMEFYTVLNALEQQARDLTIPDTNGLDRFKNGIFANPFNSHNLGNVTDFEYNIAIDPVETVARPKFGKHDIDLTYNSSNSQNITKTGPVVTLSYTSEAYIKQRFATKVRNAAQDIWKWKGLIDLYPSYDGYRDEDTIPNVNVNLDLAAPWEQFAETPFGFVYGDWRTTASNTSVTSSVSQDGSAVTTITDVSTSLTSERNLTRLSIDTFTESYDLGSYVRDVAIQPYIREQVIAFVARAMKPNTTLHAFFDDINVDAHCAPGSLSGLANPESGLENRVVDQTGAYGDPLVSDANGFVCGLFKIPASTFRSGSRVFQLSNVDDIVTGADARVTQGIATFTSDNLAVTRGSTTLAIRQPVVSTFGSVEQVTTSNTTTFVTVVPIDIGSSFESGDGDSGDGDDPLSQSFTVSNIPSQVSGVFITKVGVYFKTKDDTLGCTVYVCEMNGGFPDASRILGKGYLASADISTSATAATETVFTLEYPIYLLSNKDYAFIVQPDANSPNYELWIGETGGFDVATEEQVFSNPYSGTLFSSASRKTWTAQQTEDLKFNIYRARFSNSSGYAIFNNEDDEYITVDGFVRANSSLGIGIGDLVYSVDSAANTANLANLVAHVNTSVTGKVQYINEANGIIWIDSSTGGFSNTVDPTIAIFRTSDPSNTSLLTVNTIIAYANIATVDDLKYHAVVPKFATIQPSRTNITYGFKGTSTSDVVDAAYQDVINNLEHEYNDNERHLKSKSNEVADLSSAKSSTFKVTMTSESDFVSPMINLSKKSAFFIENLINNDVTNEHTRYGNALCKYISPRIQLKDGQEAEDIQLYLTAYRPYESDIKVYVKMRAPDDNEPFDDKVWSIMSYADDGDLVYSSPSDTKDFIEYKFVMPSINAVAEGAFANTTTGSYDPLAGTISITDGSLTVTGTATAFDTALSVGDTVQVVSNTYFAIRTVTAITNSTILTVDKGLEATNSAALFYVYNSAGNDGINEYKNGDGARFVGFKDFAIKVVLLSNNAVKVPRLNDARGIALQI